jgi:hypothetical protein
MLSFPEHKKRNCFLNKSLNKKRRKEEEDRKRHNYVWRRREENGLRREGERIERKMKIWEEQRKREEEMCLCVLILGILVF